MGRAKVSCACDPCGTCRQERSSQLSATRRFLYGEPLPAGQFKKRHPGEVSVRCLSRRSGKLLHVDVEADVFFELLQAEHIDMTALTWRESRCMFHSSPRKSRASRLQRTRPSRTTRRTTSPVSKHDSSSEPGYQTQLPALECCTAGRVTRSDTLVRSGSRPRPPRSAPRYPSTLRQKPS